MAYSATHYAENPEKYAEYGKRYRSKYKEKERLRHKLYKEKNKEKHAAYERKRRAIKRNLIAIPYTVEEVLLKYGTKCHICNIEINLEAERRSGRKGWEEGLHIDHLIEISKGGSDILENVRPSHGLCNLKRNGKYSLSAIS